MDNISNKVQYVKDDVYWNKKTTSSIGSCTELAEIGREKGLGVVVDSSIGVSIQCDVAVKTTNSFGNHEGTENKIICKRFTAQAK